MLFLSATGNAIHHSYVVTRVSGKSFIVDEKNTAGLPRQQGSSHDGAA